MVPSITGNKEAVTALGKIMIHWGSIDCLLQNLLTCQLKLNYEIGWVTYDALGNLSSRIKLCTRINNSTNMLQNYKDQLSKILSSIDTAREVRNNLAHGIWCQDDNGQIFLQDPRPTRTTKSNNPKLENCITDTFAIEHEKELLLLTTEFAALLTEIGVDNQTQQ